jgi:signal peptidase I
LIYVWIYRKFSLRIHACILCAKSSTTLQRLKGKETQNVCSIHTFASAAGGVPLLSCAKIDLLDGCPNPKVRSKLLDPPFADQFSFGLVICTAFSVWKGLGIITDSPSPIVVVLSESMEPIFHRGDLLILSNRKKVVDVGDVVVYNVKGRDIPIVHRVIKQHWTDNNGVEKQYLLTTGDNNPTDDVALYARGQIHLDRKDEVIGLVKG